MPIQNISAEFTPAALAGIKTDIAGLDGQFPALVTLTDAERKSLARVAAGREAFCETALTGTATFPTVVPAYLSVTEWTKDETYFGQLCELIVPVAALLAKMMDTKAVIGAERYQQSRKFYEAVKAAKEHVPGLQAFYEQLAEQFEGQGPGGDDEEEGEGSGEGGGTP